MEELESSFSNMNVQRLNVLEIKTVQISPFRTLIASLKDVLTQTNITFQQDGMRIFNMDKSHTMLAHMFLGADKFEYYYCEFPKIIIGIDMTQFFKLINTIDNNDTLTIYIERTDYKGHVVNYLGLKFENGEIQQCKTHKLRLIESDDEELSWPETEYSSIINLPSVDFQKIVRDMHNISERLEIKSVGNELIFTCKGSFAVATFSRMEKSGAMSYTKMDHASKVIQGEFSIKNLSYFIKCTGLCSTVQLHLENGKPLVVLYKVASLGEIKFGLVPLPSN